MYFKQGNIILILFITFLTNNSYEQGNFNRECRYGPKC